ncbi:MAG: hypothetical protein ABI212_15435, partial [Burkholderiaceae bacterium]
EDQRGRPAPTVRGRCHAGQFGTAAFIDDGDHDRRMLPVFGALRAHIERAQMGFDAALQFVVTVHQVKSSVGEFATWFVATNDCSNCAHGLKSIKSSMR